MHSVNVLTITASHRIDSLLYKNPLDRDFPGGPVVKNPSCNAGHASSVPGRGTKIPHAVGQLSLCATTTEPVSHN